MAEQSGFFDVVPEAGVEPARSCEHRILSPEQTSRQETTGDDSDDTARRQEVTFATGDDSCASTRSHGGHSAELPDADVRALSAARARAEEAIAALYGAGYAAALSNDFALQAARADLAELQDEVAGLRDLLLQEQQLRHEARTDAAQSRVILASEIGSRHEAERQIGELRHELAQARVEVFALREAAEEAEAGKMPGLVMDDLRDIIREAVDADESGTLAGVVEHDDGAVDVVETLHALLSAARHDTRPALAWAVEHLREVGLSTDAELLEELLGCGTDTDTMRAVVARFAVKSTPKRRGRKRKEAEAAEGGEA